MYIFLSDDFLCSSNNQFTMSSMVQKLHWELTTIILVIEAIAIDRGKGVPSFDEMVVIVLVEVDFDDPTTNVRGRRALAIAKPSLRGY